MLTGLFGCLLSTSLGGRFKCVFYRQ